MADHAARGESRNVSPGAGDCDASAVGSEGRCDRFDCVLSRTKGRGEGLARFGMETIRTIAWMKEKAREARQEQRIIGLVPTMGALHAGHMALIERAKKECAPVYASIFLNPKQFGPKEDLSRYPRPLEADVEKLTAAKVDGVFLPDAAEMYPHGFSSYVNVDGLSERVEGQSRQGG